jgi:hypothetical protein
MDDILDKVNIIRQLFPEVQIMYCVSPLAFLSSECGKNSPDNERTFPQILNAYSDYRLFFKVKQCWLPKRDQLPKNVKLASHGLIHIDHRLLNYETQELSIIVSCSLLATYLYVPPFNKWDEDTIDICDENCIELIKFEDGWKCLEYEPFTEKHDKWYLHPREISIDNFRKMIQK